MNRFISAMPSSMCWPFGENSQLKVEGMRSLLKGRPCSSRANRPRRLTQAPRLVETVTSGEVVTMRSANGSLARAELVEDQRRSPAASTSSAGSATASSSGTGDARGVEAARRPAARTARAARKRCSVLGGSVEPFELVPFMALAHVHAVAEAPRSAPASSGRRDCPCGPASGRPKPLIV